MKCASCTALKKCVQDSSVRHKLNKTHTKKYYILYKPDNKKKEKENSMNMNEIVGVVLR